MGVAARRRSPPDAAASARPIDDWETGFWLAAESAELGRVARIKVTPSPQTVRNFSQLTTSMVDVMESIAQIPTPTPRQLKVLRLHAKTIAATMRGDHDAPDDVVTAFGEISWADLRHGQEAKAE